jgi:hypothetical protein
MIHHSFLCFGFSRSSKWHSPNVSHDAIVSNQVWFHFFDFSAELDACSEVGYSCDKSKIFHKLSQWSGLYFYAKKLSFIAHIMQKILGIIDIGFQSTYLIREIRNY